jgi:uncharacterized protein (DUF2147 family)
MTRTSIISVNPVRKASFFAIAASCLGLLSASPAVAEHPPGEIEGLWLTDDRKGVVRISPCGEQLCGRIAQVLDRTPGVPRTDIHNPDARLRTQPLVGLLTLWGFRRAGAAWEGGRAYDPKSGKSYRSTLALETDGSLKVTGCVLFICEARHWTRLR